MTQIALEPISEDLKMIARLVCVWLRLLDTSLLQRHNMNAVAAKALIANPSWGGCWKKSYLRET